MFTPPASPLPTYTNPLDVPAPRPSSSSRLSLSPGPSRSPSPSLSPSPSPPPTHFLAKSADDFVLHPPPHTRAPSSSQQPPVTDIRARKRLLARRTTLTVLLVPFVLALITLATRYFPHPALLDVLSGLSRHPSTPAADWTTWHDASTHDPAHGHDPAHVYAHARRDGGSAVVTAVAASGTAGSSLVFPSASSTPAAGATSPPPPPPSSSGGASSGTATLTPTSTGVPTIPSAPPVLPTPFPQPFDTTMAANFSTAACSDFVSNMTATAPFRECRAFSFLSQVSAEFLTAQTNISQLNIDIWGTCNTKLSEDQCVTNMAWFADNLQVQCAQDLTQKNAMVVQSLQSLQLFDLLRQTACLADATSGAYCYVEAAADANPYDLYLYSLPFGTSIPNSAKPSCSPCAQSVMSLFASQAANFTGLRTTYNGAAAGANAACGAGYVALASGLPTGASATSAAATVGFVRTWSSWSLAGALTLAPVLTYVF